MINQQRIELSSNNFKKTRLNSEEECKEDQKKDRSESVQSLIWNLEDLPNEVIMILLSYLDTADLIRSGHVSQRLRTISSDESLWQKMNLFKRIVPTSFLQFVLERGCKYLSLHFTKLNGSLNLTNPTKLKYLNINSCLDEDGSIGKLLAACHSLEKLTFSEDTSDCILLDYDMVTCICRQNKETLKVLYLKFDDQYFRTSANFKMYSDMIQLVAFSCSELKEVSIIDEAVEEDSISYLVNNLSPNVEKLRFKLLITDEQIKTLVKRCNKLTELILESQDITNKTVTNIIEHLPALKKLNLINSKIDCATFLKFKRMPNLCVLNWKRLEFENRDYQTQYTESLKTQGLSINQDIFNVAAAQVLMDLEYWKNWQQLEKQCKNEIWEIKVKQLQMLPFYLPNRTGF
jgi:hypothetical protein